MPTPITIRELNPDSTEEIARVAHNMRRTLIEVLGEQSGTALYSMEWLLNRVRWHLDSQQTHAKIFLAETSGQIISQTIARIEQDAEGGRFGYFSTIFVEPDFRNKGIAGEMLTHTENWITSTGVTKILYNTAETRSKLIRLFNRHGYEITLRENEMVQLCKRLRMSCAAGPLRNRKATH